MRIGIFIGPFDSAAEEDGFDSLWTAQSQWVDALTMLAMAGQSTRSIELGTAVLPTFTRHPLVLAQQAATVQAASSGRLALGIGLASKQTIQGRLGLSFDRPGRHMREYLSVLRPLLHTGHVEFHGDEFNVETDLQAPNATPVPIIVAALGPRMLSITGELAEGTVTWMVGLETLRTHIVPRITSAARAFGRPQPRICVGVPIAVTDDPEDARARLDRDYGGHWQSPSYRRVLRMEGARGVADVAVVGDEREVERQLRELADAGATDLLAAIFPADRDADASVARTRALLGSLVGKL